VTALLERPPVRPKPRFRGRIHQVAFIVSIPAGMILAAVGRTATARAAAVIYAVTLSALLGTSAAYHRFPWSEVAHIRMGRLDHSMIFLLIAGTYTPFSLIVLHGALRMAILAIVWTGAGVGIVLRQFPLQRLRAAAGGLYIVLGWTAIVLTPEFVRGLPIAASILLLTGGILYTAGAVILLRNRPDPLPEVFGYHEIWHSMVTGAILCHYVAVLLLVV
jgi:hemolysin III